MLTVELLRRSVTEWNKVRKENPEVKPELSRANLSGANLSKANLHGAHLSHANLSDAELSRADLSAADLHGAHLSHANLGGAHLSGAHLSAADLSGADLSGADLSGANLIGANLSHANLLGAHLIKANLRKADLNRAIIAFTVFANVDLSTVKGLDTVRHGGPSTIGIDTLYKSQGNIPEVFLKGCGLPDTFIEYIRSLTGKAFDYYSCFISHSSKDQDFAERLYADLQANGVRCWYAPHDMEPGKYIHEQIDGAIKCHDRLLLILSESSIASEWVKTEIRKAKKREVEEGKQVLFPISLVEYPILEKWEFIDSKGIDLAEEIRKYYIPCTGWKTDHAAYKKEFNRLLKAFKAK